MLQRRRDRVRGPWRIICDNEAFLTKSAAAHRKASVELVQIPSRSPDLNPIEKYWAFLRRKLRARDLADLTAKRPPVSKGQLKKRVQQICQSVQGRRVAANIFKNFRKVCQEVYDKKGAATRC